jgi:hypothetical protein
MNVKVMLEEVRDILAVVITQREGAYDRRLTRACRILEMALDGFFDDPDDIAILSEDDDTVPAA